MCGGQLFADIYPPAQCLLGMRMNTCKVSIALLKESSRHLDMRFGVRKLFFMGHATWPVTFWTVIEQLMQQRANLRFV